MEAAANKNKKPILEIIKDMVQDTCGDMPQSELIDMLAKLKTIQEIIKISYDIGEHVHKYEQYRKQVEEAQMQTILSKALMPILLRLSQNPELMKMLMPELQKKQEPKPIEHKDEKSPE